MIKIDTFPKLMLVAALVLGSAIAVEWFTTKPCERIENVCAGQVLEEEPVPTSARAPDTSMPAVDVPKAAEPVVVVLTGAEAVSKDMEILTRARNWVFMTYKEQNKQDQFGSLSIADAVKAYPDIFTGYQGNFPNGYLGNSMVMSKTLSPSQCDLFNEEMYARAQLNMHESDIFMVSNLDQLRAAQVPAYCMDDNKVYFKLN